MEISEPADRQESHTGEKSWSLSLDHGWTCMVTHGWLLSVNWNHGQPPWSTMSISDQGQTLPLNKVRHGPWWTWSANHLLSLRDHGQSYSTMVKHCHWPWSNTVDKGWQTFDHGPFSENQIINRCIQILRNIPFRLSQVAYFNRRYY